MLPDLLPPSLPSGMPDRGCMFDSGLRWDGLAGGFRVPWKRELHLVIVWNRGLSEVPAVRSGLERSGLEIISETIVTWSPQRVPDNFRRLYATVPRKAMKKADHVGWGEFWLAIVEDHDPLYQYLPTISGTMRPTNARMHASKAHLRSQLSLGSRLHSSNRAAEFLHDGVLIFGRDGLLDVFAGHQAPKAMDCDLAGASGWRTLDDLSGVLELATPYVLLRSFDWITSGDLPKAPADLDVLAADRMDFVTIAGGRRHIRKKTWPHFTIRVAGEPLRLDVFEVDDGYLDARWAERLLRTSESGPRGFRTPTLDEHFFSLAYHVLVQKPEMKDEHRQKLSDLSALLGPGPLNNAAEVSQTDFEESLASALDAFMRTRGFKVPESRHPGLKISRDRAAKFLSPQSLAQLSQEPRRTPRELLRRTPLAKLLARVWYVLRGRAERFAELSWTLFSAYRTEGLMNVRPCWKLVTYSGGPGMEEITRRAIATADLLPSAAHVRHWDGWERLVVPLGLTPHVRYLSAFREGGTDAGPYLFYKAMQYSIDEAGVEQHLRRFEESARRAEQEGSLRCSPPPLITLDGRRSPRIRVVDGAHRLAIALALLEDGTQRVELVI